MLGPPAAESQDVSLLEDGQPPATILSDGLEQRDAGAACRASSKPDAVVVLAPRRYVRHQIDAEGSAALEHAMDRFQYGRERTIGQQRLQHPVRCQRHREGTSPERKRADVAANQRQARRGAPRSFLTQGRQLASRIGQHQCRSIDADDRDASAHERQRNATSPAAELQYRARRVRGQSTPERDVAPTERACVLPVVELRVLVPAFPAFARARSRSPRSFLEGWQMADG